MKPNSLLALFNNLRYSVGIAMLFNGFPIIFFIRDTLKIGPASNVFSALFFALALVLMVPANLFVRIYKPNSTLLKYALLFIGLCLYHFLIFNNSGVDSFVEIGNYVFIFGFFILILHVPNQVVDTLVPILFLFAFFSNLTLIYSLMTNPEWKLGMRAAVTFANTDAVEGGNPHIPARNAIISLLTALVLLSQFKNILIKAFLLASTLLSVAVIILAQVRSALLAVGLMVAILFFINANFSNLVKVSRKIFTLRTLLYIFIAYFLINLFFSRYGNIYSLLVGYWYTFQDKLMDVFFTAFGIKLSETASVDASAMGRVTSFSFLSQAIYSPELIFLGKGYKDSYLDVPIFETLVNHGILGFIFFAGFNYYLTIYSYKDLRNPANRLTLFLAYFFIYLIVLLISSGRPYDLSFWFPYVVMIRFMGIKYTSSPEKTEEHYTTQKAY